MKIRFIIIICENRHCCGDKKVYRIHTLIRWTRWVGITKLSQLLSYSDLWKVLRDAIMHSTK